MTYVKFDTIMERVYKNTPPSIEINREDVLEWTWECLSKIGGVTGNMLQTDYYVVIENYIGTLPSNIESIRSAAVLFYSNTTVAGNLIMPESITNEVLLQDAYRYKLSVITENFVRHPSNSLYYKNLQGYRYYLGDGRMYTTFETGIVHLATKSFPMSEDGEPMVLQNVYFIDAVMWYCTERLTYRGMLTNRTYADLWKLSEQKKDFYINAARSAARVPGEDETIALAEQHFRIIPTNLYRNPQIRNYIKNPIVSGNQLQTFILSPSSTPLNVYQVTLTGSSGSALISSAGGLSKSAIFNSTLAQTVEDFVDAYYNDYLGVGITITSAGSSVVFTPRDANTTFSYPVVTSTGGDLSGIVSNYI